MESSTARQLRPRVSRRTRLLAAGGAIAAAACIPFAGSAAAADDGPRLAAPSAGKIAGTPCRVGTAACVQLGAKGFNGKVWFIRNQKVVKGPITVATGGPGSDTTPGIFKVTYKDIDHVSGETTDSEGNPSQMPYSVFYGSKGEAFHGGGNPKARTAGCIRLASGDDSFFYNNLQKGDQVEIIAPGAGRIAGEDSAVSDERNRDENRNDDNNNDDENNDGGGLLGGL